MAEGTQVAVLGTEHTLNAEITTTGNYVLQVDLSTMVNGDEVQILKYGDLLVADSSTLIETITFKGIQADPKPQIDPDRLNNALTYKLNHRTGLMSITSLTGAVPTGSALTGVTSSATGIAVWIDVEGTPTEIRMLVLTGTFQDGENAQIDGSNYLVLNDATPVTNFKWVYAELSAT